MSRQRSFSSKSLVIKRINIGEADRMITLLSQTEGKIVCIAKGVRKINSTKRAILEPGDVIAAFLIKTKSMPLLTQAKLINSASSLRSSLPKIRQLIQLLEIVDKLTVEGIIDPAVFNKALLLRQLIIDNQNHSLITDELSNLLVLLGYSHPKDTQYSGILEYVEVLSENKMKSFDYLKVKG